MKDFSRNSTFRGKDRREDRQMYRATCSDCGKSCEVPFKPSGGKPVYCSNCFKKDSDPRDDRRGRQSMYRATCSDCGKSCEVPFKPSGGKPVYCSNCFGKGDSPSPKSSPRTPDLSSKKHDEINAKLDKILFLLQSMNPVKKEEAQKEVVSDKEKGAKKDIKKAAPKKAAKVTAEKVAREKTVAKKSPTKKAVAKTPTKKKAK